MEWRVGVLRAGVENIDWTDSGRERSWPLAREAALRALFELAVAGGRQEYRIEVDGVRGIARPGLTEAGELDLSNIANVIPAERWTT